VTHTPLEELNSRPFKKLPGSRRSLFEALDRPALQPLPPRPYELATWKVAKVNIDYHVEVERHWYSVPYQLVGQQLDVRLTATTVEAFFRSRRVASHVRGVRPFAFTTDPAHMPASHRAHREWTPGRILRWAEALGPKTAELVEGVLTPRPHPEQGYRSCLGILRLGKRYGEPRLEAAGGRALALRAFSYRSVESILKTGLDRQPLVPLAPPVPLRPHANLRGPGYYR
jgi:transposase